MVLVIFDQLQLIPLLSMMANRKLNVTTELSSLQLSLRKVDEFFRVLSWNSSVIRCLYCWTWIVIGIEGGKLPCFHALNGLCYEINYFDGHDLRSFVAQVRRPVLFPCFGVLKKEKHVLLPSVADIAIEQGKQHRLLLWLFHLDLTVCDSIPSLRNFDGRFQLLDLIAEHFGRNVDALVLWTVHLVHCNWLCNLDLMQYLDLVESFNDEFLNISDNICIDCLVS